jgi:hypothetical protein
MTPRPHDHAIDPSEAHSWDWLVARAFVRLAQYPQLAVELREAASVRDPHRLLLTTLGVAAIARRAGCTGHLVLRVVREFVRGCLAGTADPSEVERIEHQCRSILATFDPGSCVAAALAERLTA